MKIRMGVLMMVLLLLFCHQDVSFCSALNFQGMALLRFREKVEMDPVGGLSNWEAQLRGLAHRKLLQEAETPPSEPSLLAPLSRQESSNLPLPPSPSPAPSPAPVPAPAGVHFPPPQLQPPPAFAFIPTRPKSKKNHVFIIVGIVVGCLFVLAAAAGVLFFRSSKVDTVKPWATGLTGQLQRAFVAGVPNLKRVELDAACEDFSNIIGTFSDGKAYKGTLSSGVEIAVTSPTIKSHEGWTKNLESQFRKKIDSLSKVNHKNFVNLIGYCEENQPFTRMMVFEYAPNGTLFEHLHVKESEHLDWGMRLRIAMGMAYCLEHFHQLTPPIAHKNLQSSSIYLTEDYAAKISDFTFWNDVTAAKKESPTVELLESSSAEPECDIYSLGVILFEMVTGRIPYTVSNDSVVDWASDYLRGEQPLKEMVDPTLTSFRVDQLEKVLDVIRSCVHPDPEHRPIIQEIVAKLREITGMGPEVAMPKLSPLWWAELEILSTDGC